MEKEIFVEAIKPTPAKVAILIASFLLWMIILSFITIEIFKSQNEMAKVSLNQVRYAGVSELKYYQILNEIDKQYPITFWGVFKKNLLIPPSIFTFAGLCVVIVIFSYLSKKEKINKNRKMIKNERTR